MKRYTDTNIWQKRWFMRLSPQEKLAWMYIKDQCDNVGVWDPNPELAHMLIGSEDIDWEAFREKVNGNVVLLPDGKWWLVDYIEYQHPDFMANPDGGNSKALHSYVRALKKHGIYEVWLSYIETGELPDDFSSVHGHSDGHTGAHLSGPQAKPSKAKQGKAGQSADETHEKTGAPINSTRYENLVSEYGRDRVDEYIERAVDYARSKGKKYRDFASTAANFMKRDGVKPGGPRSERGSPPTYRRRFVDPENLEEAG